MHALKSPNIKPHTVITIAHHLCPRWLAPLGAFTANFYVFFSYRLIGKPRNTAAFSACQLKPTRILSDTNARHSTLALRGKWVSSSRRPLLRININDDGNPVAMGRTCIARFSLPLLLPFSTPPPSPPSLSAQGAFSSRRR